MDDLSSSGFVGPNHAEYNKAQLYAQDRGCVIVTRLGCGLDGIVLQTDRQSAIKSFERTYGYQTELDVYRRLQDHRLYQVAGHAVPELIDHDDRLEIIEMSIVKPPYVLDFAKAQLDVPPDFPDYVMAERYEHWGEMFGDRWPKVLSIMNQLQRRCGIYMLDPNPRNIAFEDG